LRRAEITNRGGGLLARPAVSLQTVGSNKQSAPLERRCSAARMDLCRSDQELQ
jgi:hypothetical protein